MDAHMDSVPMVAITGQVSSGVIGTDAFQEADIVGITMPITKHSFLVTDPNDIPHVMAEAFHLASTGRPGPVLVDVAKDAQQGQMTFSWPPKIDLPGYHPVLRGHNKQVREAARLIAAASKPVLYVGGGVVKAHASADLLELAELSGAPVVTTLMARGVFPDSHPQHVGMPGMHGTVSAVTALQQSDLLITLGARFDDRVTGVLKSFAPNAKVIQADIDPSGNHGVALRGVAGSLFVTDQNVVHSGSHQGVIGGQDRATGQTKNVVHAEFFERADDCL
jgi:acetolactate synthase-1/2/3 large subunit